MKKALIRYGRNTLSLLATGLIAYYRGDPRYMLISPLINAVGKYLREKYGVKYLIF